MWQLFSARVEAFQARPPKPPLAHHGPQGPKDFAELKKRQGELPQVEVRQARPWGIGEEVFVIPVRLRKGVEW